MSQSLRETAVWLVVMLGIMTACLITVVTVAFADTYHVDKDRQNERRFGENQDYIDSQGDRIVVTYG
jgi:hypothetical protein